MLREKATYEPCSEAYGLSAPVELTLTIETRRLAAACHIASELRSIVSSTVATIRSRRSCVPDSLTNNLRSTLTISSMLVISRFWPGTVVIVKHPSNEISYRVPVYSSSYSMRSCFRKGVSLFGDNLSLPGLTPSLSMGKCQLGLLREVSTSIQLSWNTIASFDGDRSAAVIGSMNRGSFFWPP